MTDREKALAYFRNREAQIPMPGARAMYQEAIKALEQPEVIRCKDCKWCEDADGSMCKNPASWVVATDRDFGCVLAERRTNG